jgi:ribA/ribD-fused uncharacterized protein
MEMAKNEYHFFWKKGTPFSQWHPSTYTVDGFTYSSAEQGMMHGKAMLFGDETIAAQILATQDTRTIKALGRQVKDFNDEAWKKHRETIVFKNNLAKFTQNKHLCKALLNTTGLLVEAAPNDQIWGIGLDEKDAKRMPKSEWKGLNLLGEILTLVRDVIKRGLIEKEGGDVWLSGRSSRKRSDNVVGVESLSAV